MERRKAQTSPSSYPDYHLHGKCFCLYAGRNRIFPHTRILAKYAYIDVPDEEIGQIEIYVYDRENRKSEERYLTDPQERGEFLSALRQIEYTGWAVRGRYEEGRYSYTVRIWQAENPTKFCATYFDFSAKDSCKPTSGNFFYIVFGNTEPVVTYMENLFNLSE